MYQYEALETTACSVLHAISHVFANDPQIIDFLFSTDRSELNWPRDKTVRRADRLDGIDREQAILARVTVDLWDAMRYTRLSTLTSLSAERLEGVCRALLFLNATRGCACRLCSRRRDLSTDRGAAKSKKD